jgi:antitoxin YefM
MTMSTHSLADTKAHLSELVNRVHSQHERITVTVHGKPSAVLLSLDDLERMEETIAVLSDSALMNQLIEAEADLGAGRVETLDSVREAMRQRGWSG